MCLRLLLTSGADRENDDRDLRWLLLDHISRQHVGLEPPYIWLLTNYAWLLTNYARLLTNYARLVTKDNW